MNKSIFLALFLAPSLICVPVLTMEKPEREEVTLNQLRATIALKAADTCYFGLDDQEVNFDRASQFYNDAGEYSDSTEGFIARYMLAIMAYANQGGLSKNEWKNFANNIVKHCKNGKAPELDWEKQCTRIARILNIEKSNLLKITLNFENLQYGKFIDSLTLENFSQIKNLVNLFELSCDLKQLVMIFTQKKDNTFEINTSVKELTNALTNYFYNNSCYQKSLLKEVQALKPNQLTQRVDRDIINLQELSAFSQDKLLQINRIQNFLKTETELFKHINIEVLTSLLHLFYSKNIIKESEHILLDCIKTCVDSAKKMGNIESNPHHPLLVEAFKIIGHHHVFKAHRGLSSDTIKEFFKLINVSGANEFDIDMKIATGELSVKGDPAKKPPYDVGLQCYKQAYSEGKPCAKARAALGLGYMYLNGEQNTNSANPTPPDYNLAKEYLEKAFHQTNIQRLKPHAAILLGHMYHYGYGVTPDLDESLKYYTVAAMQSIDLPLQHRAQEEINTIRSQKDLEFFNQVD